MSNPVASRSLEIRWIQGTLKAMQHKWMLTNANLTLLEQPFSFRSNTLHIWADRQSKEKQSPPVIMPRLLFLLLLMVSLACRLANMKYLLYLILKMMFACTVITICAICLLWCKGCLMTQLIWYKNNINVKKTLKLTTLHLSLSWQLYWCVRNMSQVLLWPNVQFTFCIQFSRMIKSQN